MSDSTETRFRQEFEEAGEDKVRNNLRLGRYNSKSGRYAAAWLAEKDQSRLREQEARKDSSSAEQMRIARSAKNAAWIAAMAAIIAAMAAIMALLFR
jgi:hypothetical protein